MITLFDSLVLGIVEGFTEFLPISSTAHLVLASKLLALDQSVFVKTFEIAIQSGAMIAVVVLFWKKFLDLEILKRVIVAFIPTAVLGLLLYKIVKVYLLGNFSVILWALALGGLFLVIFERVFKKRENREANPQLELRTLSYKKTALIGVAQAVAIVPGISRSAASIVGGLMLGLSREAIVEFSFLLAVPTILAATGLDLLKNFDAFTSDQFGILAVGFITSFAMALVSIKFLLMFIRKRSFASFGMYRIALAIVFALFLYVV